jgi:hypothetical protein
MSGFLLALIFLQIPTALQQRTGVVTGILRTVSGLPIEGVRVAVSPAEAAVADSLPESIGQSDKEGRYRLEIVAAGVHSVKEEIELPLSGEIRLRVELPFK